MLSGNLDDDVSSSVPVGGVTPDYFRAMGIPLVAGRFFDERDGADAPKVVIVNQSFVSRFQIEDDPLDHRVSGNRIVGVVGDVRHLGLAREAQPEVYRPFTQFPMEWAALVVRTEADPRALIPAVRRAIARVDRSQPVYDIATMEARMEESVSSRRLLMLTLAVLSTLALTLAAVGIYGVVAYFTSRRTHEIGIRMALGARQREVIWLMVRQSMAAVSLGIVLGAGAALALTRLLAAMLYRIQPTDPATFVEAALGLAGIALLATYLPARRTAHADALASLRHE
jgi:putative ABC transport system permease protein